MKNKSYWNCNCLSPFYFLMLIDFYIERFYPCEPFIFLEDTENRL